MRSRPSEQSRDGRYPRPSSQSNECRYTIRKQSAESNRDDSKTTRKVNTKTESFFEYVPSMQSNQSQSLSGNGSNYRKPSLPYYVVPVLYVPQKVLSSEEIRPTSASLQNKHTVSFLVKNQSEQSKRDNTECIDVDKIPCIPCETRRKLGLKKENYDSEETFMHNINLDQPYTGYINSSYTPSSTSVLEDVDYQNYSHKKRNISTCATCNDKAYGYRRPSEEYNPQAYHHFIEQQRRCVAYPNKEVSDAVRADVRLRWNSELRRYEKVENAPNMFRRSSEFTEDNNQRIPLRNRKDVAYDSKPKCSDQCRSPALENPCQRMKAAPEKPCQRLKASELYAQPTTTEEFDPDKEYCNSQYDTCKTFGEEYANPEDYPIYNFSDDPGGLYSDIEEQGKSYDSETSTLSCEKESKFVGHVASVLGTSLTGGPPCEDVTTSQKKEKKKKKKTRKIPSEALTTDPLQDLLDDASVLQVTPHHRDRGRKPKESQTMFDDVVIYSTYVATDETIKDSKSTQTLDAGKMSATTGTQTDRMSKPFESCPPPYMEHFREDVSGNVKLRNREMSPSPTRSKRNSSPTKPSIGDVKRVPMIRTVEITPKSSLNQSIQNYPLRKCKKKKARASWSPV